MNTYPDGMATASVSRPAAPGGAQAMSAAAPAEHTDTDTLTDGRIEEPWLTVVWDDPVNLMSYVTFVFRRVFGYSQEKAHELMLRVHNDGRAVVSSGSRDKVEDDVRKLHEAGLWATMQREL